MAGLQKIQCKLHSRDSRYSDCLRFSLPTISFIIFSLFIVLANFPFTTNETMGDYYLPTWYVQFELQVTKKPKSNGSAPIQQKKNFKS